MNVRIFTLLLVVLVALRSSAVEFSDGTNVGEKLKISVKNTSGKLEFEVAIDRDWESELGKLSTLAIAVRTRIDGELIDIYTYTWSNEDLSKSLRFQIDAKYITDSQLRLRFVENLPDKSRYLTVKQVNLSQFAAKGAE